MGEKERWREGEVLEKERVREREGKREIERKRARDVVGEGGECSW